jgi:cellulose biosynthesis protein BcsQ
MATTNPRYAVWNNKGGVGKTFVSFIVAAEYARIHRDRVVVVIDMCPQANVSEILLGGNGEGAAQLEALLSAPARRTIGGYFDLRVTAPHVKTGSETSFLLDVPKVNKQLPTNLFMVAGDPSLEVQTQAMNQIAAQTLPANAWANVHRWLIDMVDGISTQYPSAVFFIDCNPSFSAYTELALLAANRLIIPCTADGSSARAIDNIGQLLYGVNVPTVYARANFSAQAKANGLRLPIVHMVPLNRSTQYDKKASRAFGAMYGEIQARVHRLQVHMPTAFSSGNSLFLDIPDAHSVSVVASHFGTPLAAVNPGSYDIHGVMTQLNPEPLDRYRTAISALVAQL